tara:strand:+ start:1093 stop:1404 length:312 start_codon:yes stop_codon:yes gene_type:complete
MPATPVGFDQTVRIDLHQCTGGSQFNPDWVSHATRADAIAGEQTALRRQGQNTGIFMKKTPVALDGSVIPHGRVHGSSSQNRALTGQQKAGQQALSIAVNPSG